MCVDYYLLAFKMSNFAIVAFHKTMWSLHNPIASSCNVCRCSIAPVWISFNILVILSSRLCLVVSINGLNWFLATVQFLFNS